MEFPDLEGDVQSWISAMRDAVEADPDSIPVVGHFPMVEAGWDDICELMIDEWSPEFRQRLLSAFSKEMQTERVDIASRYTALTFYERFLGYLIHTKEDPLIALEGNIGGQPFRSESTSLQIENDLHFLVDCIRPENLYDWRTIRWEITNAYLIKNWERAFQLYDRAEQLGVARQCDLLLMRGHLQFLLGSYRCQSSSLEDSLRSTCHIRKRPALHPFNWEPMIYDSESLPLALLLLASGLNTSPAVEHTGEHDEDFLRGAIKDIAPAQQKIDLPAPYRAIVACCHFRLGALHSAIAEYNLLLSATTESPWTFVKPHVYRAIATCHVQTGDVKKAIKTLSACIDEFPRERDVYFEMAGLQAQDTDFAGAAVTVRRAAEAVPDIDNDWRLSTILVLRGMMDNPKQGRENELIEKLREIQPVVWHLIERTCSGHWPAFPQLCPRAKERWTVAVLQGYYHAKLEESATRSLEVTAIRDFALAVEIELESRVFGVFKYELQKKPKSKQIAQLEHASAGHAKMFCNYLTADKPLSLGQMEKIISFSRQAKDGILSEFGDWLMRTQPQIAEISKLLSTVVEPRNLATHGGLTAAVDLEDMQRACRAIIDHLHRT